MHGLHKEKGFDIVSSHVMLRVIAYDVVRKDYCFEARGFFFSEVRHIFRFLPTKCS